MNRYLLPASLVGSVVGGFVLLNDMDSAGWHHARRAVPAPRIYVDMCWVGFEGACVLAVRAGARVILACRDEAACEDAAREIRGETLNPRVARRLDLASLESVRDFAAHINQDEENVHILVNNAAVMRCPHSTTADGFEMQFGVNHLGHFLLTNLLLDKLRASAPSRVVTVSSLAQVAACLDLSDLNWERRKYDPKLAYCDSKLANVLFSLELSKRLQGTGVTANSVNPGVCNTSLGRHTGMHKSAFSSSVLGPFFWLVVRSPRLGAQPSINLAVSEELRDVSGRYFDGMRQVDPGTKANDEELARQLWEASARLVCLRDHDGSGGGSGKGGAGEA
uniref:Retinol dehydrogenase 13 n=1 Tax=Petromyzon marinus TaxID=7757 RepID=S4RXS7_PETMA